MSRIPILSAIIIAKNEAARIGKCIDALSFADEVIVVDNSSTDRTADISRKHGAVVLSLASDDFSELRNRAQESAHGAWLLYIDADEVVSKALAEHIKRAIQDPADFSGFSLYRKNYYLGMPWPSGEWKLRLFRRDRFSKWFGALHESPMVTGNTGRIRGELLHDTHRSLEEMVDKTNEWSDTEARLRLNADHPPVSWWRMLRVMMTGFLDSYIGQGGWRAGTMGWIESMYQGFSMFITYAKLWEKQQRKVKQRAA